MLTHEIGKGLHDHVMDESDQASQPGREAEPAICTCSHARMYVKQCPSTTMYDYGPYHNVLPEVVVVDM